MSKERDLLVSCLDEFQYHEVPCSDLIRAIRWVLAEPEEEPKFNFDLERMKADIYAVMCHNDSEPVAAFTTRIDALNYAKWLGSTGRYRLEVVEIELREENEYE